MSVQTHRFGSVVVIVAREALNIADANVMMELFHTAYSSGAPYAVLLDARGLSVPPPDVRRRLSESPGKEDEISTDRGQHIVVVIDSPVLRGAMTAIQWFLPKSVRLQTAKTAADGVKALASVGHPKDHRDLAALNAQIEATDAERRRTRAA